MSIIIHAKRGLRPLQTAPDIMVRVTRAAARAVIGCLIPISDAHGVPAELIVKEPRAEAAYIFSSVDQRAALLLQDKKNDICMNRHGIADDLDQYPVRVVRAVSMASSVPSLFMATLKVPV